MSRKLDVTQEAVMGFFRILNEKAVPLEKLSETLAEIAQRHRAAIDRVAALNPEDPETQEIVESARSAIEIADYDRADQLLAQAEAAELAGAESAEKLMRDAEAAMVGRRLRAVDARGQRGELSMTRLEYLDAAAHFKAAGELVPAEEVAVRADYLNRYAGALYSHGDEKGDNAVLVQAIWVCRNALGELARERVPLDWATTQDNLGNTLMKLGERQQSVPFSLRRKLRLRIRMEYTRRQATSNMKPTSRKNYMPSTASLMKFRKSNDPCVQG